MNIDGKKIVIYGKGKRQKDFEYIFDNFHIEYYLEDENYLGWERLEKENKEDIFVIICCENNEEKAKEKLEKYGLKNGTNFCMAYELFYKLNFLERRLKNRKLLIWGTGNIAKCINEDFKRLYPYISEYKYIDNDLNKENKVFLGHSIVSPHSIKEWKKYYIVIAIEKYTEVKQQLQEYGLIEDTDFTSYIKILYNTEQLMRETYFAERNTSTFCQKPFGMAVIAGEQLHVCCPGFQKCDAGSIRYSSFKEAWKSIEAKIFRLSIINGTYCFCRMERCNKRLEPVEINCNYDEYYKKRELEMPEVLINSLDYSCNIKCKCCRENIVVCSNEEFIKQREIAEKLLEEAVPAVKNLWMCGNGEVFFSKVYQFMLYNEKNNRKEIHILTNGILFDEKQWTKLRNKFEEISVSVSVDAITKNVYEEIRRGGDFNKLEKNLKMLGKLREENKIKVFSVNMILSMYNFDELCKLVNFARENHIDIIKIQKYINYTYSEDEFYGNLSLHEKDGVMKEKYRRELLSIVNNNKELIDYSAFEKDLGIVYQIKDLQNEYVVGII